MPCRGSIRTWTEHHGPGLSEPMSEIEWDTLCCCVEWNASVSSDTEAYLDEMENLLWKEADRSYLEYREEPENPEHFAPDL